MAVHMRKKEKPRNQTPDKNQFHSKRVKGDRTLNVEGEIITFLEDN